jgi:hypothetical protein
MRHFSSIFRTSLNSSQFSYSDRTKQLQFGNQRVNVTDDDLDTLYYARQSDDIGKAYSIFKEKQNVRFGSYVEEDEEEEYC